MTPYPHQLELAEEAYKILAEHMIVYLAMQERTGKTLTAIVTCEKTKAKNWLVLTKKGALKGTKDKRAKDALEGWFGTLRAYTGTDGIGSEVCRTYTTKSGHTFTVTNYHQAKKVSKAYEGVILDEAHNYLSAFPKASNTWKEIKTITKNLPLLYMSATPYAQGAQLLYHQFHLSSWSPFKKWSSSYSWFRSFGIPETIFLSGRQVETYKKVRTDEVLSYCNHLFITKTRTELGFEKEPTDKVHYIELSEPTREVYNILVKQKVIELNSVEILCDTTIKLRTVLHQLEGGTLKTSDTSNLQLGNCEKVNYIKTLGFKESDIVIMYQYKAEKEKLEKHFPKAKILQATSFAEGVDLSNYEHLIVYSQDWSTARHSQRRARQANMKRTKDIIVHFLLVKDAISDQVYNTVSINRTNFVDSVFEEKTL